MERRSFIVRFSTSLPLLFVFFSVIFLNNFPVFGQNAQIDKVVDMIKKGHFEQAHSAASALASRDQRDHAALAYKGFAGYIVGKDVDGSLKDLESAIRLAPDNSLYAGLYAMALNSKDVAAAKTKSEAVIKAMYDPKTAMEFFARGRAYLTAEKPVPALEDLNQAIKLDGDFAFAYSWRSRIFTDKNELSRAVSDLERVIKINNHYLGIYERLGNIYSQNKNYSSAITAYTKALEIDGETSGVYHNRGVAYRRAGKNEDGYKDYTKAIEFYNKDLVKYKDDAAAIYFNRGICYANKNDFVNAAADFTRSIELKPKIADGYYKRAEAYENLGKMDLAKADRRKYTDLGGQNRTPQPNNFVFPEMTFDIEQARAALGRGYASITGIVCTQFRGGVYRADGIEVFLYPATPYLDAWYKLRDKRENNKKGFWVYMNDDAFYTKTSVVTNDQGRFVFADLKPGRYFLQAFHAFSSGHSGTEIVAQDSTTDYYRNYRYSVPHNSRIEKFVDLKPEEEVKITMKAGKSLIDLKGCL